MAGKSISKSRNRRNELGCNFKRHLLSTADTANLKKHMEVVKLAGSHGPFENKTLQAKVFFDSTPTAYEVISGRKSECETYMTHDLDEAIREYNNS